ncbi:MAG: PKD domain-containing protein [Rhodothermales bacterium]|nr:PKD domain-containing protein [Rhodothermales bacterium]
MSQISFSEVSGAAGVGSDTYDSTSRHGLGVNWIDYDNDGFPDLFLPNGGGELPHLFRNNAGNGTFTRKDALLPALPVVEMTGSVFADYDNDGDMDIYITVGGSDLFAADGSPNFLLKNLWVENGNAESDPMFVEVAAAAGVDNRPPVAFGPNGGYKSYTATWLDYDLDSCIDLFVGTMVWDAGGSNVNRNALYKNDCDGTFTNVTTAAGLYTGNPDQDRPTLVVFGGLMDDDLYPDLYVVNVQQPAPYHIDQYFHNNGNGTFTDLTSTMPGIGDDAGAGMGIDLADIDLDGDWDIYMSDLANPGGIEPIAENNVLYKGNPNGTWSENSAPAAGVKSFDSWAVNFFDLNHDGYEELLVGVIAPTQMKDELYQNDGDGTFTDISVAAGMISGDSRGSAAADYDRDGDLDFAIVNLNGTLFLYKNNTAGLQNWLQIDLDATVSNRAAIGALIEVKAGGKTYARQVKSGVSAHSQNEMTAHFGLATATTVNEIKVSWPSGAVTVVNSAAVNQRLTLVEDGTIGNTPPSANFTSTISGLLVDLDASSSTDDGGIASYLWDFGDGATDTLSFTSYTYAAAGTYTVTLTVTDAEGLMDSASQDVTVSDGGGGSTGAFLESGGLVSMEAENAHRIFDHDDHIWSFSTVNAGLSGTGSMEALPDDGTRVRSAPEGVSPEMIFDVNFATPGTYYVWHRLWGGSSKANKTFSGAAGVSDTSPLSVGTFSAWTWTNGKLDGTDATIVVSTPGVYSVHVWMAEDGTLIDKLVLSTNANFTPTGTGPAESPKDGGGTGNNAPVASFTHTATDLALSFDGSASSDSDGSIVSYAWTFGDGATGTGATASHTYAAAGTYTVALTVTDNDGAAGITSQSVTVTSGGGTGGFIEAAGMVVMEAEHFHANIQRGADSWVSGTAYAGASGGSYMDTTPDDNTEIKTGAETTSPELSFDVNFSTTGSYYVWGRIYAPGNKSNSMHAGINGAIASTTNGFQTNTLGQWVWVVLVKNGVAVPLSIGTAGTHTVHAWMREDGTAIDKLVLTTDAAFVPTGVGPAESPQAFAPVASAAKRGIRIDGLTLHAQALPTEFALEGNYPNPFNPSTTIRFALPEAAVVRLSVYDMLGREVARVFDSELPAGRHEATWNGRTDAGTTVSSGAYLLRMTAGSYSATTRMVAVK